MTPAKAFNFYFGMSLHFSSKDYSILKYGPNTSRAVSKYESLTEGQRFRFEWLSRRFPETQDMVYACIGCQFDSISMQFDTKEEIIASYTKFKGRREGMSYHLRSELAKNDSIPIDKLIFKYFGGSVSPELILVKTHGTELLEKMYDDPRVSFGRDKILKLIKYKDFFSVQKYLHLDDHATI